VKIETGTFPKIISYSLNINSGPGKYSPKLVTSSSQSSSVEVGTQAETKRILYFERLKERGTFANEPRNFDNHE
jgi:hypothetical protein